MIVLSVAGWSVYALLSCIKEFVKIKSGIMSQCFNSPLFSSLVVLSLAIYTFFRLKQYDGPRKGQGEGQSL